MIQDKICVAPHQIFDYDLDIQEVGHNGAEEYIRKDALVELINEEAKFWDDGEMIFRGLIDKINSL